MSAQRRLVSPESMHSRSHELNQAKSRSHELNQVNSIPRSLPCDHLVGFDLGLAQSDGQTALVITEVTTDCCMSVTEIDITEGTDGMGSFAVEGEFSFSFPAPSLSSSASSDISTDSEASFSSWTCKRPREGSCLHLFRLKKSKTRHSFVRSAALLGYRSDRTPQGGRRSDQWVGTTPSRSSHMAPSEQIWTDEQAASAWTAHERDMSRQFEQLCLGRPGSSDKLPQRRRALTAPESDSIAASLLFCRDQDDDDDPIPCRLSPESEDSLALVEELSIDGPESSPMRNRSISAPASLDAQAKSADVIEDPAVLKAQLLSVLRQRNIDNGGSPPQPGEAALKLRKWVVWNAWNRRTKEQSPPALTRSRTASSLLLMQPVSAFDESESSDDADGEDEDDSAFFGEDEDDKDSVSMSTATAADYSPILRTVALPELDRTAQVHPSSTRKSWCELASPGSLRVRIRTSRSPKAVPPVSTTAALPAEATAVVARA